jgi:deferrochelatase/peroxidase EfeB
MGPISRRRVLAAAGAATGAMLGGGAVELLRPGRDSVAPTGQPTSVPFSGVHQAGIVTPQQAHLCFGAFDVRWRQTGFGPTTAAAGAGGRTPRSLLGHKDGTNNLRLDRDPEFDGEVWAGADDTDWMRGGTYLVARRIRILLEAWDRTLFESSLPTA